VNLQMIKLVPIRPRRPDISDFARRISGYGR
jgi:hypothetical protein